MLRALLNKLVKDSRRHRHKRYPISSKITDGFQGFGRHGIHWDEPVTIRRKSSRDAVEKRFHITAHPADIRPDCRCADLQRQWCIALRNAFEPMITSRGLETIS